MLDVGALLGQLATLLGRRAHALPVGMFGFSLGGAAAAEALLRYPRLRAAVDLDGRAFGTVVQSGLDQPLGIMVDRHGLESLTLLALLVSHLRGPHPIQQLDVEHHGFTDFVVFNPEATPADPALGAGLEAAFATGVDTLAAGTAALSAQRRFLTTFMDRYLSHCHPDDHARARSATPHPSGSPTRPLRARRSTLQMPTLTSPGPRAARP